MNGALKIGTDCSGIEAPIQALDQMGIEYNHLFSSEIDKWARKSILANYNPKVLYDDMTQERDLPKLDIYVCGFPCQPFSMVGRRKGSKDERSNIFIHVINTIKKTKPKLFILENVRGIMSIEKGQYFKKIKELLNELEEKNGYKVNYWILNTKDYGIPQNRERLYIVGSFLDLKVPEKIECKSIESYIDYTNTEKEEYSPTYMKKYDQFKDATFCTPGSLYIGNKYQVNPNYSSTITTNDLWNIKLQRKATINECLALQGFPTTFDKNDGYKPFIKVVSNTQMRKQIGNSMSVNVLKAIFNEWFESS